MVAAQSGNGKVIELTRGQETELPRALKWQLARADEDYDAAVVEARRITVEASRVSAEAFPIALPPEEAERRCRRALMEAWVGRESASFRLLPSRLAIDPGDVLWLNHDARLIDLRVVSVADSDARAIDTLVQDRVVYDLPLGAPRATSLASPVVFGSTEVALLDIPQLSEQETDHQPLIAGFARPWPGNVAVWRSYSDEGFDLFQTFGTQARLGTLAWGLAL